VVLLAYRIGGEGRLYFDGNGSVTHGKLGVYISFLFSVSCKSGIHRPLGDAIALEQGKNEENA
jgi:hypothetical protein